jgi:hypothetical protein
MGVLRINLGREKRETEKSTGSEKKKRREKEKRSEHKKIKA